MATIFWDLCGVILIKYLERGRSITADRYCGTLTRLRKPSDVNAMACWVMCHLPPWQCQAPYCSPNSRIAVKVQVGSLDPTLIQPRFHTHWTFSSIKEIPMWKKAVFRQWCEKSCRELAQWEGTWFLPRTVKQFGCEFG